MNILKTLRVQVQRFTNEQLDEALVLLTDEAERRNYNVSKPVSDKK